MFDIILATVDGSTHSEKALEYAGNLAEGHGSDLFLFTLFPTRPICAVIPITPD